MNEESTYYADSLKRVRGRSLCIKSCDVGSNDVYFIITRRG